MCFCCRFESGEAVAKEMGISPQELKATFDKYNEGARMKKDPFGKKVRSFCSIISLYSPGVCSSSTVAFGKWTTFSM